MTVINKWYHKIILKNISIAPLIVFRIVFGLIMLFSTLRFVSRGWINDLYVTPKFHFTYYGFDWIKPMDENGMFAIFIILILSSILITLGLFYRLSAILFFLCFTYIELIDKTNYLNHYYFISLISFILIFLPAHRCFSLDIYFKICKPCTKIPAWNINIIKFQIGVVYFFAGVAKLNYYWLFEAQPLINWLKHETDLPIIGSLMKYNETAYLFSWSGAMFDLLIVFALINKKTRLIGYTFVISFHTLTYILFPSIGVFPIVMIFCTLIFFSENFHEKTIHVLGFGNTQIFSNQFNYGYPTYLNKFLHFLFGTYIFIQLIMPIRYLLYPGNLFWTEQGYRFSWRVMLIEKAGNAKFFIYDQKDRPIELEMCESHKTNYHLTPQQEKMMSTQPDMILQYAHHLRDAFNDSTFIEIKGQNVLAGKSDPIYQGNKYDYYINLTENTVFGPKTINGKWPTEKKQLIIGEKYPSKEDGNTGDFFLNKNNNTIFGPKKNNAQWGQHGELIYLKNPKVTAEIKVSLFNKGSELLIDPNTNLSEIKRGFHNKSWITPYPYEK